MRRAASLAVPIRASEAQYAHARIVVSGPLVVESIAAFMATMKTDRKTLRVVTILGEKDAMQLKAVIFDPAQQAWRKRISHVHPMFQVSLSLERPDLVLALSEANKHTYSWLIVVDDRSEGSDLVSSVVLGADRVMVPYTDRYVRMLNATQTVGQTVWFLDPEGALHRHSRIADTMELGRALRDGALASADYVEHYGTSGRLLESRVVHVGPPLSASGADDPVIHWVPLRKRLHNEVQLVASSAYDEQVKYFAQRANAAFLHQTNIALRDPVRASERHVRKTRWLAQFTGLLEAALFQPVLALSEIAVVAASTRRSGRSMQFFGGDMTAMFAAVHEALRRTIFTLPDDTEIAHLVIVPDLVDFDAFRRSMAAKLGLGGGVLDDEKALIRSMNLWFIGRRNDAATTLEKVFAEDRRTVLVLEESALRRVVPAGSIYLRRVHNLRVDDFTLRGAYNPCRMPFLSSLFGSHEPNVHLWLPAVPVAEAMLTYIRRRKRIFASSFDGLDEFAHPPPLVRLDAIPVFERPLDPAASFYSVSDRTPLELLKEIELWRRPARRVGYVASDVPAVASRIVPVGFDRSDDRLRLVPWIEEFAYAGMRLTGEDVTGLAAMVAPLRAMAMATAGHGALTLLAFVLGLLNDFFTQADVDRSRGVFVDRAVLSDLYEHVKACKVELREKAQRVSVLCASVEAVLMRVLPFPNQQQQQQQQHVGRRAPSVAAAVRRHLSNPRLLLVLNIVGGGTRNGRVWFFPALLQWWRVHSWTSERRMKTMVWDVIQYVIDKQPTEELRGKLTEQVLAAGREVEWF